jgi:hypothetical protein
VLLLFAATSCGSSSAICNCPANGCDHGCDPSSIAIGEVRVGPPFPAVSNASADGGCSTQSQPSADRVLVFHSGVGTCNVRVQFSDGSSYAAQVRFSKVDGPCGCTLGGFTSALEPTDAGSD